MKMKYIIKFFLLILLLCSTSNYIFSQELNKALANFLNNEMNVSVEKLIKIYNTPSSPERGKAAVALALIHKLNEDSEYKVKYFVEGLKLIDNPDAYAYTLWGNCDFYNYPKYSKSVLDLFREKKNIHPDINYCLDLLKSKIYLRNDEFDSLLAYNNKMGYIDKWELLGAFDYMDGYGYNNHEQTLMHPESDYQFIGIYNSPLKWFSIPNRTNVTSIYLNEYIESYNSSSAKMYAQTFITSQQEQEIKMTIISGMDIKCWLNDVLIYENRRNVENIGGLPYHIPIQLQKGNNRILFQLGLTPKYSPNFAVYLRDLQDKPLNTVEAQISNKIYSKQTKITPVVKDPDIESFNVQVFTDYIKKKPNDILEQLLRIEELNSTGDKAKTLVALAPLYSKFPNSYYLSNMYYHNKDNINFNTKDEYLNTKCEHCYSTLYKKLTDAIDNEDKTAIQSSFEKLDKHFPNNINVLYKKIEYYLDENEIAQASKLIEEGLSKSENYLVFNYYKNSLLYAQAKKNENLEFLKSIFPSRNQTFVSESLKSLYLEKNDTINWIELQTKDLIYDKSDKNYIDLIAICKESKKYDLSEKFILEYLNQKPYSSYVWENYGDLMLEKGNKEKALECFAKSLLLNANDYEVRKKILTTKEKKTEIEILLPQTLKEIFLESNVAKIAVPMELKNKNWIVLYKKSASVTYENGTNVSKYFQFYKILNDAGIKEFKEINSYSFGSDIMIFKEDGQIELPENGAENLVLPNLKVGDIIGFKIQSETTSTREYKSNKFKHFISLIENEPKVIHEEINLISKKINETPIIQDPYKQLSIEKKSWNEDFNLYTVNLKNPVYIEPELASSNSLLNSSSVVLHNYQSWDEVSKWYWDIASPSLVADDNLKSIVREIIKGNENASQYKKAELIYRWITYNINYSSQSFRQDNYVPQLPAKVLHDNLGDCKDLSALFITMCREIGIKANYVLVNMEKSASLFRNYPNINFNHCIAKVYVDNKSLFVELTSQHSRFGQNMPYAVYGHCLEVAPELKAEISDLFNDSQMDICHMESRLSVKDDKLSIKGNLKFCGLVTTLIREGFAKVDSVQVISALNVFVSSIVPNGNIIQCDYNSHESKSSDTLNVYYEMTNNDVFTNVADMHVYKLQSFLNKVASDQIFTKSIRKTELSVPSTTSMIGEAMSTTIIEIPKDKKIFKKPENIVVSNPFFEYMVTISESKNEIKINRSYKSKAKSIKVEEFNNFKTEMEKAYKADIVTIVLQ